MGGNKQNLSSLGRCKSWAFVKAVMNFRLSYNAWEFLTR